MRLARPRPLDARFETTSASLGPSTCNVHNQFGEGIPKKQTKGTIQLICSCNNRRMGEATSQTLGGCHMCIAPFQRLSSPNFSRRECEVCGWSTLWNLRHNVKGWVRPRRRTDARTPCPILTRVRAARGRHYLFMQPLGARSRLSISLSLSFFRYPQIGVHYLGI